MDLSFFFTYIYFLSSIKDKTFTGLDYLHNMFGECLIRRRNCSLCQHLSSSPFFCGSVFCSCLACLFSVSYVHCCLCLLSSPLVLRSGPLVVHVVLLYVFMFLIQCCDVHYHFRIKTMFSSSLDFTLSYM